MTVREATQADVEQIVQLGQQLQQNSAYKKGAFNTDKAKQAVSMMITSDTDQAFIAESDGKIIGFFLGGVTYEWFSDDLIAFDYSVYVVPEKRNGRTAIKLFKAFEEWATEQGAKSVQVGITTGINIKGNSRLYRFLGFKDSGVLFEKRL